jgi:hypothetical protein
MIALINIVIGISAIAVSVYLLSVGGARNGQVQPFLRNGVVMTSYVMAILVLFVGGVAWVVTAIVQFF